MGFERVPEAIAEFQAAAKVSPREPNLHFGLGYLYWRSHQYDEAKREFETELALDPNNAQALTYLGDIEMKRNNLDTALSFLRKAVQARNDIRVAYIDIGAILMQQKQYEDATTALRRAVALDPAQPDAHYRLGQLYRAIGNTAAAQAEFGKVHELHEKADEGVASKMPVSPASSN